MALPSAQLAEGEKKVVEVDNRSVMLVRFRGDVYASIHVCPHQGANLAEGELTEEGYIQCPRHRSLFDLKTGEVIEWVTWPPVVAQILAATSEEHRLPVFPAREENGEIQVDLDAGS
jgi:nitrite reductase/ring-hydroxylating ferredoxin subunit